MKLLSVGKFIEKIKYQENFQDYKTWCAMGDYFDEIYLVVESPDSDWHYDTIDNLYITWIPQKKKPLEFFYFIYESFRYCKKIVIEKNINVLNASEPLCAGLMAAKLKSAVKKPLVVQIQGQFFNLPQSYNYFRRRVTNLITKYVSKKADRLRVVSDEIKKTAIQNGINEYKIFVSPSRCDTDVFDVTKHLSEAKIIKKQIGCQPDDKILVFVGRLIPAKDIESILESIPIILKKNKNIKLLIAGSGELEKELKHKSEELHLAEYVIFLGAVPYDKVPSILATGDIFVSPSLDEGLPRSVLEAMSMKLAVIVTSVGGNPEIIQNNINGCFVDIKCPEQIAEKVVYLLEHPAEMAKIRETARKRIVDQYEFKKCIKSFAEIHYME